MARKKHHEEHENHERWLVSYADFITLLFAFFVVMYSVSRVDNKRMAQASKSIQWALHFKGTGGVGQLPIFDATAPGSGCMSLVGEGTGTRDAAKALENIRHRLENRLKPFLIEQPSKASVLVDMEKGKLTVRLAAAKFFDPGQAALRAEALPVVDAIAAELKTLQRPIRIEAHTDAEPLSAGRYRNNWDLSSARASTVTALLEQGHDIPAAMLTAAGLASARPLVPNDSREHREQNRRVEMVVDFFGASESDGSSRP